MNRLFVIFLSWTAWTISLPAQQEQSAREAAAPTVGFATVELILDTGQQPLAAYQVTLTVTNAGAKIVGIEGGESPAFKEPPYYDPKAIQHERVILAAFSTVPASQLPKGRTRVATIHLQLSGEDSAHCTMEVQVAAGSDGSPVPCTATANFKGSR